MARSLLASLFAMLVLALAQPVGAQTAAPAPAAPAAATPPARGGPIAIADFARLPFMAQPRISPDGTYLASMMGVQGKQVIAVQSLFNAGEKPTYLLIPDGTQASWIRWVNKDNLLIGVYALLPIEAGERWHISRLLAVNRNSGKVTRILWDMAGQNAADVVWVANDGKPDILVAAQNSIYLGEEFWPAVWRINVETGKRALALRGRTGVMNWFADASGTVRSGISYDDSSRKFKLLYRGPEAGTFKLIDTAESAKQEGLLSPFLFLPGTAHAYAVHDDDKGRKAIFEIDLVTQNDLRTVYVAPEGSEVETVEISADGTTLLGATYSGKSGGIVWFDPVLAEVQSAIEKSVPGRRAQIVSMSDDRRRLLIRIDQANNPGSVFFFDLGNDKMQRIATINEGLGSRPLGSVKMIQYTARDGLAMEAVLTLPRDRAHRNLPVILMPHGGPWAQDTLDYDYWAQFLASRGYAVIQPNFRGSTGYGTAFLRAGEGQMGLAMQDDISDALAWAVKQGIADPGRACIVGASYGGYAAMWGIAKDPDLYRCAVSIAGVSNIRRDVNDFGSALMGNKFRDDWKRMTPDFAAVSPINAVERIKAPLLLIHGKKDITVDWVQSSSMAGKMRGAGKPVELVVLPEADHSFTREADRVTLLTSIEGFLVKHNPPDPVPAVAATAAK